MPKKCLQSGAKDQSEQCCRKNQLNWDQAKEIKQQNIQSDSQNSYPTKANLSQQSLFSYHKILASIGHNYRELPELTSQLISHGISFDQNYSIQNHSKIPPNSLRVLTMKHTKYFQVTLLKTFLGPFSQILKVYNTLSPSISFNSQGLYHTNGTGIYLFKFYNKKYIAKSTAFSTTYRHNYSLKSFEFRSILQQYFITKLMSILKIGPKLCLEFGFDIFLSEDKAVFFIQFCQSAKQKSFTKQDESTLLKSLKQMHLLSIVHRDIKPDNIMYSASYNKFVFIDFGISQYRLQEPGQLVMTSFMGTYAYSTEEMKKIFKNRQAALADIYLNDAFGLWLSIQQMKNYSDSQLQIKRLNNQNKDLQNDIQFNLFLEQIKLKYIFFLAYFDKNAQIPQIQKFPCELSHQIMKFLYQIPLTELIRKIYKNFLEPHVQNQQAFQDLKLIFQSKIYFQSCKGKLNLFSTQKLKNIDYVRKFYQQIELSYSLNQIIKKLPIQKLQFFLCQTQNLNNQQNFEYELYMIEYLNLKRMKNTLPIEKKLEICKNYILSRQLKSHQEITKLQAQECLELVFHCILSTISPQMKKDKFFQYLRALENYFIIASDIDLKILIEIDQVMKLIEYDQNLSYLDKIQRILLIQLSIWTIPFDKYKIQAYDLLQKIFQTIIKKVRLYTSTSINSCQKKTCEVYLTCIKYFFFEYNSPHKCDHSKLLEQLNSIQPQSAHSLRLINFIRYRLLIQIEKADNIYIQKMQIEEIILEQMESQEEINTLIINIICCYHRARQIKMLKKFISVFDACIQLESVFIKHFINARILIQIVDDTNIQTTEKFDKIDKISQLILPLLKVNSQNIVVFLLQMQNLIFLCGNIQQLKIPLPQSFIEMYQLMRAGISHAVQVYENSKLKVSHRGSINLFYIELLSRDIEFEYQKILKKYQYTQKLFQYRQTFYPDIISFQKIIHLDRSTFCTEDHIFLLSFDIIYIKSYNQGQRANRQILQYMKSKQQLINTIFTVEKTIEKTYTCLAFSLMLYYLLEENNIQTIRQGVDFIYSIVQKKFSIEIQTFHFNHMIIKALVKLERFQSIFDEIINSSKFYTDHLSKSNIVELSKFYSFTIYHVVQFSTEKQFYEHLEKSWKKIDMKKTSVLGIFLLFCIRPFNRKIILKLIIKSLENIKYNGKYFILSRFYKQLLKLKEQISLRKKQKILRYDVKYPSKFMLNLEEMKRQLNCRTKLQPFWGKYKQVLDKKVICLGQCCEVYSSKRQAHPLNGILDRQILDKNKTNERNDDTSSQNQ